MKNIMLEIWIAVWLSVNLHKSVVNWQLVGHSKHVCRTTECTIWIWAFWGASAAVCVQSLPTSYPPIYSKPRSLSLLPSPPSPSPSPCCSYKLWYNYLKLRRAQVKTKCIIDPAYEGVNSAFERALVFMHKVGNPKLLCCALVTTCQVVQLCKHVLTSICLQILAHSFNCVSKHMCWQVRLQMHHVLILPTFPILSLLPSTLSKPCLLCRCLVSGWTTASFWWTSAKSQRHGTLLTGPSKPSLLRNTTEYGRCTWSLLAHMTCQRQQCGYTGDTSRWVCG